ncbi:toll/interleukin-1 receptor domain-containing protein [Gemmatimonas sp.]|uniref:toll/interleukin-1 receptor domain-containing protein n=1 Tax=Gemmatimonas sp. TaxID=1962908 RepID=UPI003342C86E
MSCFVAHEDIAPTLGWQEQIERALFAMDAMLAIHTEGFSESVWTQQEIGVAIGRGVKIISLKLENEDPKGFIARDQAILRRGRTADAITPEIVAILTNDPLTKTRYAQVTSQEAVNDPDEIPF